MIEPYHIIGLINIIYLSKHFTRIQKNIIIYYALIVYDVNLYHDKLAFS